MKLRQAKAGLRDPLAVAGAAVLIGFLALAILSPLLATDRPLRVAGPSEVRYPALETYWRVLLNQPVSRWDSSTAGADANIWRAPVPYSPDATSLFDRLQPPSAKHWLGTDELGRDVMARMVHGTKISLLIGFVAAGLSLVVGATMGAIAGYYGGVADWLVSRATEIVLCFPFVVLLLAILALFRPSIGTIIVALGLTTWTTEARLTRGEILRVRETEYAQAARASGAGGLRIVFRHLLPNAIAPALVSTAFGVSGAIALESALSFLGFGVQPPVASWGTILSSADDYLEQAWWLAVFPGIAIFLTVAACNLVGEQLREAIDPRE